ncbi:MAG: hypothetical protein KC656_14440 [Myxococcales bacterium]|nr:hypothetical protein [Myxococcales bacterium]MCB9672692.1 hypothetical protein [Alphaproteobacteria bacterium]
MAETYAFEREIRAHYTDPTEVVWLAFAARMGLTVRRSADVYATTDGRGLLTLSTPTGFDPDDTVAQMVFHEVCHWIVNGESTFSEPDWGFELDWEVDWREYACQRVQAVLASTYGLERLLASTGTYRPYYDAVLAAPLVPLDDSDGERVAVEQTLLALERAAGPPWAPHLQEALAATARLKEVLAPFLADYRPDHDTPLGSIWS